MFTLSTYKIDKDRIGKRAMYYPRFIVSCYTFNPLGIPFDIPFRAENYSDVSESRFPLEESDLRLKRYCICLQLSDHYAHSRFFI